MPDQVNGDGEHRRIDRDLAAMREVMQSMTDLMLHNHQQVMEQQQGLLQIIRESRHEIQDLLELQREQRIDIMALFQVSKETRKRVERLEKPEG